MESKPTEPQKPLHVKKPEWLKTKVPTGSTYFKIKQDLRQRKLYTVCEEAKCPNIGECWSFNTATFMILGDTCTRACRFCHVKTGNPGGWYDKEEPVKVAESVQQMGLKYVVITMVDRDDMEDGGAFHCKNVFNKVRNQSPSTIIEFLGGDFSGKPESLSALLEGQPKVYAHNIETVRRLTPRVRDARATYDRSLGVLRDVKKLAPYNLYTKSSIMLGLGETEDEIVESMKDLRAHNVDFLTLGQYMRPTKQHLSIKRWVHPDEFAHLKQVAESLGFLSVASGPLVRSSYRAWEFFNSKAGE
ncbi:MAG: lipoyl synthase [Oligoflexales bacterium]